MNVESYGRPRLRTALVATMVAALAGIAHAAGFDEKLKAPVMKDTAELRSQSLSLASRLEQYRNTDPQQLLGDAALVRDQFDLVWKLQRAIDQRRPLNDLADVGLTVNADGSVEADVNAHPQWLRFDERLSTLIPGWDMTIVGPELMARGFRDSDLAILESYVKANDIRTVGAQRVLPIGLGFNKLVTRFDKARRPVSDAMVLSYVYQQARERSEASREWTAGLFSRLDLQRRRILLSYVAEMRTKSIWTATEATAVADTLADMRRPDFAAAATSQAMGVTK